VAGLDDLGAMPWQPIPPLDYLLGVLGGLALGAAIASAAIAAAILTP
jgi:hypothetical protein